MDLEHVHNTLIDIENRLDEIGFNKKDAAKTSGVPGTTEMIAIELKELNQHLHSIALSLKALLSK